MNSESISRELRAFFRWLRVLEKQGAAELYGTSRWYKSRIMECYTRAGVLEGWGFDKPVVCLANIRVMPEARGHGLFTSIVRMLQDEVDQLALHRIEVECVHNPKLADWLARNHFSLYPRPSEGEPSTTYFLDVELGKMIAG